MKVSLIYVCSESKFEQDFFFQYLHLKKIEKEIDFVYQEKELNKKENILSIDGIEIELFLLTKEHSDLSYIEYVGEEFSTETLYYNKREDIPLSLNIVFKKCTGDYICIVPSGIILNEGYLIDLIFHYKNTKRSGIIGISSLRKKNTTILPLQSSDVESFNHVICSEDNHIEGLLFFERQKLFLVGGLCLDSELANGVFYHLCIRHIMSNYLNYYIPTQNCTFYNNPLLDTFFVNKDSHIIEKVKKNILEMKLVRSYYIPI